MSNQDKSWGTLVITACVCVSIVLIVFASVKRCSKEIESASEEEAVTVAMVIDDTTDEKGEDEYEWEAEIREQIAAQVDVAPERQYIGKCRITVYNATESSWGYQTATGRKSEHLTTCAVDPKVIPYGSNVIVVDKDGEEHRFRAIDCGGFSGKWVDIFFDGSEKHGIEWLDECFGGEFAEVYVEVAR